MEKNYVEKILKFNGEDVRFRFDEFNNAEVLLQDVAKYCGWTKVGNVNGKVYSRFRWTEIKQHLTDIGLSDFLDKTPKELKSTYIKEHYMYMLIGKANNGNSREFMKWVGDIISNIRKNGFYVSSDKEMEKWFGVRKDSKTNRKNETDQIKLFVEYAEKQGSKSFNRYYIHFSNLANEFAGIESNSRDEATQEQLIDIITAENAIKKYLKKEMDKGVDYKKIYQIVKNKIKDMI